MSRVLVVYATKTGCTKDIAEQIGASLTARGNEVTVVSAAERPGTEGFDAFVVGSGVRVGSWHGSAKSWVAENAAALASSPTALFTACLTMATDPQKADEVRAYTDAMLAETGVRPVDVGLFAGMNVATTFSLPERLVMKALKAPAGDFRDLAAVAAWADGVAPQLGIA